MPTLALRATQFCPRCLRGDHSREHREIGCLARVGYPPNDFVCACEVKRGPRLLSALPDVEEDE
jgi:hypothetical protein